MAQVEKAYEITDAKISFVSLVDKAANKKTFLITKAADGEATFQTCGRIIKADAESHHITGIVYEPLVEDSHGNFMTEAEIEKAAYWFTKNGNNIDVQHSFEPLEGACVVENWVAKADFKIGEEQVKKGTWLMTVEVNRDDVWEAVQKGEITGFSMGGVGTYSEEDTKLETVAKKEEKLDNEAEKKGLFKKMAEFFGMDVVEKGAMADDFNERTKATLFWNAFYSLEDLLYRYNWRSDKYEFETDEAAIKEALEEFTSIVQSILVEEKSITKALAIKTTDKIEKSGRKMSKTNKETLQGIYDSLGTFLNAFADPEEEEPKETEEGEEGKEKEDVKDACGKEKEETDVKKSEVEQIVQEAIKKSLADIQKAEEPKKDAEITKDGIEKMVSDAIEKAMANVEKQEEPAVTAEAVQEMVSKAVEAAIEPVLKSRGVPSNLGTKTVEKQQEEPHYLKGIL